MSESEMNSSNYNDPPEKRLRDNIPTPVRLWINSIGNDPLDWSILVLVYDVYLRLVGSPDQNPEYNEELSEEEIEDRLQDLTEKYNISSDKITELRSNEELLWKGKLTRKGVSFLLDSDQDRVEQSLDNLTGTWMSQLITGDIDLETSALKPTITGHEMIEKFYEWESLSLPTHQNRYKRLDHSTY